MKKLIFSVFVLLTFLCAKCEDDTPKNPIDLLPPATQIGANTFGCLVDGEPFTPDGRPLSFTKDYVPIENGYALEIKTTRYTGSDLVGIGLIVEDIVLNEQTYILEENLSGNASGLYIALSQNNYTSSQNNGEITISKFDYSKKIISGSFWFNVQDHLGVIHQIREGRFDIKY